MLLRTCSQSSLSALFTADAASGGARHVNYLYSNAPLKSFVLAPGLLEPKPTTRILYTIRSLYQGGELDR